MAPEQVTGQPGPAWLHGLSGQVCTAHAAQLARVLAEISATVVPCHQDYLNTANNHGAKTEVWPRQHHPAGKCHVAVAISAWLAKEFCLLWGQCWEWPCSWGWGRPQGQEQVRLGWPPLAQSGMATWPGTCG